jgi:quinol monooxygenase YgiN
MEQAGQFGIVALHYPRDEFRDEMAMRVARAAEVMATVPGCIEALCWREEDSGIIVATGKWASEEAWRASLSAVADAQVDFDYDERESRPREVFNLSACRAKAL